jgi:RimJ/RimL family protein N-acetyltransferase
MSFDYRLESLRTAALEIDYYLVPWDARILGRPVAQIADIRILEPTQAARDYEPFAAWCRQQRIALCTCRLPAARVAESMFLEHRGFRFVELNYTPQLDGLQTLAFGDQGVGVARADSGDRDALADMAAKVFSHGRWHQDPRVGAALGNQRYRAWMENAFAHAGQTVLKCLLDAQVVGFFVVESRAAQHRHWSLNGLAPGLQGRGLGKRVWRAMLQWHRDEGVDTVTTSISSHNVPAFNLYVGLGFRFPPPSMTLQWCDAERLA